MFVDWHGAPHEPYHSSPDDLTRAGSNRILHVPIASHDGVHAYLHHGFHALKPLYEANMNREVICSGYATTTTPSKTWYRRFDISAALERTLRP